MATSAQMDALPDRVDGIEHKLDALSESCDRRFDEVALALVEQREYTEFGFRRLEAKMDAGFARIGRRLGLVDRRLELHDARFDDVTRHLESHDRRFDEIERRLEGHDRRFDEVDRRLDAIEQRMDGIEQRMEGIEQQMEGIDGKLDKLLDRLAS